MATRKVLLLLCFSTELCATATPTYERTEGPEVPDQSPRTLHGSPQEKFSQIMAYHKLKTAVKTQAIECHKRLFCQTAYALGMSHSSKSAISNVMRGAAHMSDSFLGAFAKGWLGQDCLQEYTSCDSAKDYVRRLVQAMMSVEPDT
ncbi:uncharacterized protein LOC144173976 [Haemaphysalis longicornis]